MAEGEDRLRLLGQHGWRHICLSIIAEVHAGLGQTAHALASVNQAIAIAEEAGIESWRPEFLRQRAQWMLALGEIDRQRAKEQFAASLALARRQTARMFELRATTSLARMALTGSTAERASVADMLAACLDHFSEGADGTDVMNATCSLAELRSA